MTTDDLAGILAEHGNAVVAEREGELKRHWRCAACNTDLGVGRLGDLDQLVAAHQAAVIAAAGWKRGWQVEWATGIPTAGTHIAITRHVSEDSASWRASQPEAFGPLEVFRRHVTDWEPAE